MFDSRNKRQIPFGSIRPSDDALLEIRDLRKEARNHILGETFGLLRDIILILVVFILFGVFVVQPVVVEGESMVPNLHEGERLLVNKLIYYKIKSFSWGHIERGDVVVFWYPKDPNKSFVKRVLGLPGDTVEVRAGRVFVNGTEYGEPYLSAEHNRNLPSFPPRQVEDNYYFVMGDNRDNSSDSRYWGLVPEKYIYGKVFFRYWRPSQIGFIENGHPEMMLPNKTSEDRAENLIANE